MDGWLDGREWHLVYPKKKNPREDVGQTKKKIPIITTGNIFDSIIVCLCLCVRVRVQARERRLK